MLLFILFLLLIALMPFVMRKNINAIAESDRCNNIYYFIVQNKKLFCEYQGKLYYFNIFGDVSYYLKPIDDEMAGFFSHNNNIQCTLDMELFNDTLSHSKKANKKQISRILENEEKVNTYFWKLDSDYMYRNIFS